MNVGDKLLVGKKQTIDGNEYVLNVQLCEIVFFTLGGKKLILKDCNTDKIFTILMDEYEIRLKEKSNVPK